MTDESKTAKVKGVPLMPFEILEEALVAAAKSYLEVFPYTKTVTVRFFDDGSCLIEPAGRDAEKVPHPEQRK